jgi:uncharacterized membrane protein (DUF4010 family)
VDESLSPELQIALRIAAAAIGGLAVGVERQWSGHASGPGARFGGMRTFALLGGLAGIVGWLWTEGSAPLAAVLLGSAAGLILVSYALSGQHNVQATTEVAGLIVLAAGVMAGMGNVRVASGVIAVSLIALLEKSWLHDLVKRLNDAEIRAGSRFAVMAVVILPLLPEGPYGPLGGVRPRQLWTLVLLFSGLSFAGYIARRIVGAQRGYAVAGLLGGLVSSTSVTLSFARASRAEPRLSASLAAGVVAASTVLFVRTLFATAILSPTLAYAALPLLGGPFLVAVAASALSLRGAGKEKAGEAAPSNPLQLRSALQMTLLFQIVLFAVYVLRERAGDAGVLASGVVVGFTDVDALTVSLAKNVSTGLEPRVAAQAIALGILSNTVLKLGLAAVIGEPKFRWRAGGGLAAIGVAVGVAVTLAILGWGWA